MMVNACPTPISMNPEIIIGTDLEGNPNIFEGPIKIMPKTIIMKPIIIVALNLNLFVSTCKNIGPVKTYAAVGIANHSPTITTGKL